MRRRGGRSRRCGRVVGRRSHRRDGRVGGRVGRRRVDRCDWRRSRHRRIGRVVHGRAAGDWSRDGVDVRVRADYRTVTGAAGGTRRVDISGAVDFGRAGDDINYPFGYESGLISSTTELSFSKRR